MADYKVPQDVEAEDKLLGPFSFRQFIYLICAAIGIGLCWAFWQIFPGLVIIPIPVVAFFLLLALPLKKDQPMEAYMLAMVQFFIKPHQRYWNPDGNVTLVEITAPPVVEKQLTKNYSGSEASERLAYLAGVVDTGGWSTRGVNPALTNDAAMQVNTTDDVLDDESTVGQSFDDLLSATDQSHKQAMIDKLRQAINEDRQKQTSSPSSQPADQTTAVNNQTTNDTQSTPEPAVNLEYNPYPTMRQHVVSPNTPAVPKKPPQTDNTPKTQPAAASTSTPEPEPKPASPPTVSPDIMRLANNNDLSISAIARQAHKSEGDNQEVVISLH